MPPIVRRIKTVDDEYLSSFNGREAAAAMQQWLDTLVSGAGVIVMYAAAFLEGAGFPLPYEAVFLAYAVLADAGEVSAVGGLAGLLAATTLGNVAGYVTGRFFGRKLLPWMLRRSAPLRQFWRGRRIRFRSRLLRALIALRWLGFGFGPAIWAAGLQRTPLGWFIGVMALVNAIWVTIWGLLAQTIVDFLADLRNPVLTVALMVAVVVGLLWVRARWRRRRGSPLP